MAVTATWVEFNGGASGGSLGSALVNTLNFGGADVADLSPVNYPIIAGTNSFVKYWKVQWSGSFTKIENLKLWKSAGVLKSGEYIKFSGSYIKVGSPSATALPDIGGISVPNIPTSQPGNNNIAFTKWNTANHTTTVGSVPNNSQPESSPGYYSGSKSSMMVFQLQTAHNAGAGAVNQKIISLTYDRQ